MKKTLIAAILTLACSAAQSHVHTSACADAIGTHQHSVSLDNIQTKFSAVEADASNETVIVDLMAFYQPSYESKMGVQFVHQRINTLVENTNIALKNSGLNVKIRLVNAQKISGVPDDMLYTDPKNTKDAGKLASSRILNPYSDFEENKIYTEMGADLALYIRDYNIALQPSNTLGNGELGGELSTVFDTAVLAATDALYKQGDFVLAHEIGHNFMAGHLTDDYATGFLPEAHAYTCAGKNTVMGPADPNGHRFYSSPLKFVNGEACGVAGVADNTSVIAKYAPVAAKRRTAPIPKGRVFFTENTYQYTPGSQTISVSIKRDGDLTDSASVQLGLIDSSAKAGIDFTDTATRITFEPGQDTAVFSVFVPNSSPKGKASIVMRYPHKLTVESQPAALVFTNEMPGSFSFVSTTATAIESAGTLNLTINRVGGADGTQSVRIYTTDLERKSGIDFVALDSIVTFEPGQTTKTVTVTLIDNKVVDTDGTFAINMTSINGSEIGEKSKIIATMTNNDTAPPTTGDSTGSKGNDSSSGGSLSWLSSLALLLVSVVRQRKTKTKTKN